MAADFYKVLDKKNVYDIENCGHTSSELTPAHSLVLVDSKPIQGLDSHMEFLNNKIAVTTRHGGGGVQLFFIGGRTGIGTKFFLVLDDVWTEDFTKWEPPKKAIDHGRAGSKSPITTRKERVAETRGEISYHIGLPPREHSWAMMKGAALRRDAKGGRFHDDLHSDSVVISYDGLMDRMEFIKKKDLQLKGSLQQKVNSFIAEPFYCGNHNVLDWKNLMFWKDRTLFDPILSNDAPIMPRRGLLKACAMHLPDLWKSRRCLKEIEGFVHSIVNTALGVCGGLPVTEDSSFLPYFIWQCDDTKIFSEMSTILEFDLSKPTSPCTGKAKIQFEEHGNLRLRCPDTSCGAVNLKINSLVSTLRTRLFEGRWNCYETGRE